MHKALNTPAQSGVYPFPSTAAQTRPRDMDLQEPGGLVSTFERSSNPYEVELKYLAKDPNVFPAIHTKLQKSGFVAYSKIHSVGDRDARMLLSRQLATHDDKMKTRGVSIRIRGSSDGTFEGTVKPDICVKIELAPLENGEKNRLEYEARIDRFDRPDFGPLLEKYPLDQHPELKAALEGIQPSDLVEEFRIEAIRDRFVVGLPPERTGITGKTVYYELLTDNVAFIFDPKPCKEADGRRPEAKPIILAMDNELEVEILTEACEFDENPDKHKFVTPALTDREQSMAFRAIQSLIAKCSTPDALSLNNLSKCQRGQIAMEKLTERLIESGKLTAHKIEEDYLHNRYRLIGGYDTSLEEINRQYLEALEARAIRTVTPFALLPKPQQQERRYNMG